MNTLADLPLLHGARVLVRVDYNVPIVGNRIRDTRRITASYKTIDTVLKKGGTPILIAHRGDAKDSLKPVATFLKKKYNTVFVTTDITTVAVHNELTRIPKKTVVLLENIRRYEGEGKNDVSFVKHLASLGSYYINDAFSVSHRKHASVVGLPKKLPAYCGAQLSIEIATLAKVINQPKHPFVFILGGAKCSTKIPLVKRFVASADSVIVAGAIANNFFAAKGFEVGNSVVESGYEKEITALLKQPSVLVPIDVVVERKTKHIACTLDDIEPQDVIVDIGPQTTALIEEKIAKAKLVVWNGPTGWYEKGYTRMTTDIARSIAQSKASAVIGGGDTGAVVETALSKTPSKKVYISTGGGATLAYLTKGTLPGIAALK